MTSMLRTEKVTIARREWIVTELVLDKLIAFLDLATVMEQREAVGELPGGKALRAMLELVCIAMPDGTAVEQFMQMPVRMDEVRHALLVVQKMSGLVKEDAPETPADPKTTGGPGTTPSR